MSHLDYTPVPSVEGFVRSEKFQDFIVGPVGPVSGDTEYLTQRGWVPIADYAGEHIAVWEQAAQTIKFERPADYIIAPAETLLEFECSRIRMCLSENHRVPYYDYRGQFQVTTAGHVAKVPSTREIPRFYGHLGPNIMSEEVLRLAVAINADGHLPRGYKTQRVHIVVRKERKKQRLRVLLERCDIQWKERCYPRRPTEVIFSFDSPYYGKRYDGVWWEASRQDCEIIIDEMRYWDGLADSTETRYYTTHKEDAEFIQYAACATGGGATIRECTYPNTPTWKTSYTVHVATRDSYKKSNRIDGKYLTVQQVPAPGGKQYCFETSTTFFLARYKGFVFVTGNSTKTTAAIMKIVYEASRVAKARDGKRRSRYAVVRNTKQQLQDATIPDFLKWLPDGVAGSYAKTDGKFYLRFNDVESEILFRGLDDTNDVRRLLSLQLTGAFMDEFREINPEIFNALTGRLGRYPDGMLVPHKPEWGLTSKGDPVQGCVDDRGREMKRIWGSTNPPDLDSFWQQYLTEEAQASKNKIDVFIQPGGMSEEADWIHLLPADYYEDLIVGKGENWINVYVHAKWGESLSGKPVFRSFNADIHVAKLPLRPIRSLDKPLIVGMDFGLNPSAVIGQIDMFGRLVVFKALTSDGMGVTRFIQTVLRPTLVQSYPGMPVVVVGDPAGVQRGQTDERSCFDILKKEGFRAVPARTNNPVARVAAVDMYLNRLLDGKPGLIIDPSAQKLIVALRSGYRYKIKKSGDMDNSPEKNEHSHIADALQYLALHADGGLRGGMFAVRQEIQAVNPAGWT